jgi:hypothetical protein
MMPVVVLLLGQRSISSREKPIAMPTLVQRRNIFEPARAEKTFVQDSTRLSARAEFIEGANGGGIEVIAKIPFC